MQSRPTENLQESLTLRTQESPTPPTQHGLDHIHEQSSRLLSNGESCKALPPLSTKISDRQSTLSRGPSPRRTSSRWLNNEDVGLQIAPSTDRITDYEHALTPSRKIALEGPHFQVVQEGNKSVVKSLTIADFPNGD